MILVRRFLGLFQDSPTYGRDRANLITGFSIGTAGLLLNGAVLMVAMPLLSPGARDFNSLANTMEFGQLLALILLGGATAFATLLIPLRLATVFWEPRIGRYFDQIVLSGIMPLRFMIGKVTSQNLFLALIFFLLLPYFIFSLTLGGVNLVFFAAGLFLVWLYCMELALVTLWLSLYLNELLAALVVIILAATICSLGSAPMPFQPFMFTPFPVLLQPVYEAVPPFGSVLVVSRQFLPTFAACAIGMTTVIAISLVAIHLGPLFGIIRENSTFGEVVRVGDSKRKRWFRIRQHIQRSSEIEFFYRNRIRSSLSSEGLLRWGFGFLGLILFTVIGDLSIVGVQSRQLANWGQLAKLGQPAINWQVLEFHRIYLTLHGLGLALAVIIFSHPKNSTYLRLPFFRGWKAEVSKLDTTAFLVFALISTAASIATPYHFEQFYAEPVQQTVFPSDFAARSGQEGIIDFDRIAIEGTLVILIGGLVVYALQRLLCLWNWTRTITAIGTGALYVIGVCVLPLLAGVFILEMPELRTIRVLANIAPTLAVSSPFMMMALLFNGAMGMPFPPTTSTAPFYIVHGLLLAVMLFAIRRRGRKVRELYLAKPIQETSHV